MASINHPDGCVGARTKVQEDDPGESVIPHHILHDPELRRRRIVLKSVLKPDVVFRTASENAPNYVVKAFDLNTEELQIYERLLGDLKRPANHTPPSEILRSTQPFLIMPVLSELTTYVLTDTSLRFGLRVFYELIQGVEYLHDLHIAHLDIYPGNAMVALPYDTTFHKSLVPDRIYIIDFDTARQFSLGPGVQPAIILPETQPHPPNGLTHFDPYSWDVYCLGRMFEYFLEVCYASEGLQPPWIARRYVQWLVGNERGCTKTCRCRPRAKTARRVLTLIRWVLPVIEALQSLADKFSNRT
ncbi:hypothetical protein PYCCODRAFT_1439521 [Trametes coccinea BRFM310]|uniref:Protein kinase domain-containing protein n=1 Tax=Trametes coccinea (strain BRFM310) TaxID=1353009 RepID=A0A1Y2IE57_TRAC3|nr:hypothetical protein PYCCODRAFT_1439521 [Trametes coccinea BRFM310]